MSHTGENLYIPKGTLPDSKGKLSDKSVEILKKLSSGLDESAIFAADMSLARVDIIRAAREALVLNSAAMSSVERAQRILSRFPRAYEKWSPDEEKRLIELYKNGRTMREIAAVLQRQPNAIKNRLAKIGYPP